VKGVARQRRGHAVHGQRTLRAGLTCRSAPHRPELGRGAGDLCLVRRPRSCRSAWGRLSNGAKSAISTSSTAQMLALEEAVIAPPGFSTPRIWVGVPERSREWAARSALREVPGPRTSSNARSRMNCWPFCRAYSDDPSPCQLPARPTPHRRRHPRTAAPPRHAAAPDPRHRRTRRLGGRRDRHLPWPASVGNHNEQPNDAPPGRGRVGGRRPRRAAVRARLALVSSRRRIDPCERFSRTRLTDVLHRRHSATRTRPGWVWGRQRFR
jgi:hypothetical protein